MCVRMYVCTYVYMYVCMYVHVYMYVCMYVCIYVHVCMYLRIYIYIYVHVCTVYIHCAYEFLKHNNFFSDYHLFQFIIFLKMDHFIHTRSLAILLILYYIYVTIHLWENQYFKFTRGHLLFKHSLFRHFVQEANQICIT